MTPPLRPGFDVTSAVKRRGTGIARYVRSLLAALPEARPEVESVLFVRDRRWLRRRLVADLLPKAPRRWLLDPLLPPRGVSAFHALGVHLPRRASMPRTFTLHDLRGLDAAEFTTAHWVEVRSARLRESVGRADGILCLTAHGRARLAHHFPAFPLERTAVVPHGIDGRLFRPGNEGAARAVLGRLGLKPPFLLQVGTLAPHKNPEASLDAFSLLRGDHPGLTLAFAGTAAEARYLGGLEQRALRLGIGEAVRWLGHVPEADLPALYSGAAAVLFPSHYEGFGMPVLEAMACGAPGVVSSGTCLEEVAGGAWPAAPPADPARLAAAAAPLLEAGDLRRKAIRAGRERAQAFTWLRCARETLAFMERIQKLPLRRK